MDRIFMFMEKIVLRGSSAPAPGLLAHLSQRLTGELIGGSRTTRTQDNSDPWYFSDPRRIGPKPETTRTQF